MLSSVAKVIQNNCNNKKLKQNTIHVNLVIVPNGATTAPLQLEEQ